MALSLPIFARQACGAHRDCNGFVAAGRAALRPIAGREAQHGDPPGAWRADSDDTGLRTAAELLSEET